MATLTDREKRALLHHHFEQLGRAVWAYYRSRAINRVQWLMRNGHLARLTPTNGKKLPCRDCRKARALFYDHRDYLKPSVVTPVCPKCNARRGHATLDIAAVLYHLSRSPAVPPGWDPDHVRE